MLKEYWELTKQNYEKDNPSEYTLWIKSLQFVSEKEDNIEISAPDIFVKERVTERYLKTLTNYLFNIAGKTINISIIIREDNDEFNDIRFDSEQLKEKLVERVKIKPRPLPFLNPKYTFERYITGDYNNLACAAAKKIVQSVGSEYNPFFVYGEVGLGKTHLIQAIAHALHEQNVTLKIVYVTAEQFLNDFTSSIRSNNMPQFRLKYRSSDVLLIDDIQFLENTDKTQEEIFHIYNTLKNEGKQMVFTSDRAPSKLVNITDRLISRFKSGLVVEIKKPSLEMRKKILKLKLEEYKIELNDNLIDFISETLKENVRDIESTVNRIRFLYCDMGIKNITEDSIKNYLDGIIETGSLPIEKGKRISVEQIQKVVANHYNINYTDMKSKKRTNAIAKPRQIAMCLTRELTSLSTIEIGNEFGGRNHSTVIFAIDKVKKDLDNGQIKHDEYEELRKEILN